MSRLASGALPRPVMCGEAGETVITRYDLLDKLERGASPVHRRSQSHGEVMVASNRNRPNRAEFRQIRPG